MTCVICKHGQTAPGQTTVTLERDGATLVFQRVPAEVCDDCGEAYVDGDTTTKLLKIAVEQAKAGIKMSIREFAAA